MLNVQRRQAARLADPDRLVRSLGAGLLATAALVGCSNGAPSGDAVHPWVGDAGGASPDGTAENGTSVSTTRATTDGSSNEGTTTGIEAGASDATQPSEAGSDSRFDAAAAVGGNDGAATDAAGSSEVPINPALLSLCAGTNPITCAFDAPNGNYRVTVELGAASSPSTTRVEAETRRIVLQPTATTAGTFVRFTFAANVRQELHDLYGAPGNVLNLSFDGTAPAIHGIGFAPAAMPTIHVAGDSTVCDWDPPAYNPFASYGATDVAGWAQELSQYLGPGVAVANYADSGETAGTFYAKFFPAAQAAMKPGDYLFIQFGHNDMKTDSSSTYRSNLTKYLTDARAKNVVPVLITPVSRSSGANFVATDGVALDQTMRDLAASQGVALIDLTKLSLAYYAMLGAPAKSALFIDGTHFHEAGATQIAGLIARALAGMTTGLETYVR